MLESSNVLHSRSFFLKSDTGDVVHHYSPFDGNYTFENYMIVKIYGTKVRFPVNVTANGIIGCRLGSGESGRTVIASAAKL